VQEDYRAVVRNPSGVRSFVITDVRKEPGGRGKAGHVNDEEGRGGWEGGGKREGGSRDTHRETERKGKRDRCTESPSVAEMYCRYVCTLAVGDVKLY
jgi:hypothetical protein